MFSPGNGVCEAVVAVLAGTLPAFAGSGLLTAGATAFVAVVVGTAAFGAATGLAGEVAAGTVVDAVTGAVAGFVVASVVAVVIGVESEATCVAGAGAGTGRGTAGGVAGFAELDDEAGCSPANTNTRSICGWATASKIVRKPGSYVHAA